MFFLNDDERDDQDLDHEDDADIENSDDDAEDGDDAEEGDDSQDEDDFDDEDDDSDDSDDSDEDDDSKKRKKDGDDPKNKSRRNRDNARRRKSSENRNNSDSTDELKKDVESIKKQQQKTALLERKRTFGYENSLSPKQVDHVFRLTKRPTAKFLNEAPVKAALDAIKSSESVSQNTPRNNGRTFTNAKGKKVPYTKLPADERQSRFADRRRAILEDKGR